MNFLTLTPEFQDYFFFILLTWCLGCSNLASHVYSRYLAHITISPLVVQCIFKGLVCLALWPVLSISALFAASVKCQLISILLGLLMGGCVTCLEVRINRSGQRLKGQIIYTPQRQMHYYYNSLGPANAMRSLAPSYKIINKTRLKKLHQHYAAHEARSSSFSLGTILLIAIFEEIIFRGYVVQLCGVLPNSVAYIVLIMSIGIFGISHASFGVRQIIAKTILGGCCMLVVLLCHTLLPALITHSYLNWMAFRYQCRSVR